MKTYRYFVVTERGKDVWKWKGCSYVRMEVGAENEFFGSKLGTSIGENGSFAPTPSSMILFSKEIGDLREVPIEELVLVVGGL